MINFVTSNSEVLSLVIALLALLIAVYSVLYTHHFNKRSIAIDENYVDFSEKYPLISFCMNNMSPVPVKVCSLTFLDNSGQTVKPIDFVPDPDSLSIVEFANPLRSTTVVNPHNSIEVSYFFEDSDKVAYVTVSCTERIYRLRKHQTFELKPVNVD